VSRVFQVSTQSRLAFGGNLVVIPHNENRDRDVVEIWPLAIFVPFRKGARIKNRKTSIMSSDTGTTTPMLFKRNGEVGFSG